ncbi:hypothetical protein QF028_004394 [Neobacillus sp. B4I6]
MKKPKYIVDHDSMQFKKQLREHMQLINPKPDQEERERRIQELLKRREK